MTTADTKSSTQPAGLGAMPGSDLQEQALRWVLDKIRSRQREIRDIQDRFTAVTALHDADIMRIRYNELDALAEDINRQRYALNNPNDGTQRPPVEKLSNPRAALPGGSLE